MRALLGDPGRQRGGAVLEQLAVGVDAVGAGREGALAQRQVIVLADGQDRAAGGVGDGDRLDPVVGAGGQVDDDAIDVGQERRQARRRSRRERRRAPAARTPSARRVAQMRSSARIATRVGAQANPSARWWKTSRAVTTPVGRPSSRIGMCRNPPTAILWMATAIGSSWRSTTGSGVMKSRTEQRVELGAGRLHHRIAVGEDADEALAGDDEDAVGPGRVHRGDRDVDGRVGRDDDRRR